MRALIAIFMVAVAAASVPGWFSLRRAAEQEQLARTITAGDPHRARTAIITYGCAGCHRIPGIQEARGQVGPPLTNIAGQIYIAGVLVNTPENLVRWIMTPTDVDPRTAMPATGIPDDAARDIAAYLYSR